MFPNDNLNKEQGHPADDNQNSDIQESTLANPQTDQPVWNQENSTANNVAQSNIRSVFPQTNIASPNSPTNQNLQLQSSHPGTIFGQSGAPLAKKSRKKKFVLSGALAFLIIALVGGYAFAFYIPSMPENVYKTGMDRSGRGLEKVITQVTTKSEVDRFKKGEYKGTLNANFSPAQFNGTADVRYDSNKLDVKVDVTSSQDGQKQDTYKAQVLSEINEGSEYPDIYFVIQGIKSLGLDSYSPELANLDGTWIKVDSEYIKEIVDSYRSLLSSGGDTDVSKEAPQITSADVEELGKITSSVIRDFGFTKDESKSIFVNKGFIGKEKVDGMNTYHYRWGVNADNYVTACIETANRYLDSSAVKRLIEANEEDIKKAKEEAKKSCEDEKSNIQDDEDVDLWIDAKYKLIYKIRSVDSKTRDSIEIGQKYKGGDDLHFFVNYQDENAKNKFTMTADMNIKSLKSTTKIDFKGEEGSLDFSIDGKPLEGEIKLDKPNNPKSLKQVLEELGFNDGSQVLDPLGVDVQDPLLLDPEL